VLRPAEPEFSKYLYYYIQYEPFLNQLARFQRGTSYPAVRDGDVMAQLIPVPPKDEARRIVAEIEKQFSRLDEAAANLTRVKANLKRYKAAVLKAAVEGKLVFTETEWCHRPLTFGVRTLDQGWSPKCENEPSGDNGTWGVIKTTAIQPLKFIEIENKELPARLKPRPKLELVPGDLLVTRAGPRSRVGVACLVKKTRPRLMLCDKAYRLKCQIEVVHPAYLEIVLNAPQFVDAVNELKTGISDSGCNLTQKRFGELLVPFPSLAEQQRIVSEADRRLSVLEELNAAVNANLQCTISLRQSILQRAFDGKLTAN
jgi:type I restriction enzyme, S subunit